jgi:hypothetical protein
MNICDFNFRFIRILYAFTALILWIRFLYYFRVFKTTNFYIRMIGEVVLDMG